LGPKAFHVTTTDQFCLAWNKMPDTAASPTKFSDTSLVPPYLATEICYALRAAYPAGEGSVAILRRMVRKSQRVRVALRQQQPVVPSGSLSSPEKWANSERRARKLTVMFLLEIRGKELIGHQMEPVNFH